MEGKGAEAALVDGAVTLMSATGAPNVLAVTSLEIKAALGFTTGLK